MTTPALATPADEVRATDERLPLVVRADLDAPLAWRAGTPVSARRFLADVAEQAEALPAEGAVLNLCTDRYCFAVGVAAALCRGLTSLMPPNALPPTLARLQAAHPGLVALADDPALDAAGVPVLQLPCADPARTPRAFAGAVPAIPASQIAARLLTSGSTGDPQPHAKRWGSLRPNVQAAAARWAEGLGRDSLAGVNLVATVPPQHMYGFESSVLVAMLAGAAFDAGRPFYPADVADALARLPQPRALVTTPFHLKALLQSGVALPPTELLLCATAPLSPQLAQQAEQAFGGALIEIYGCTEAGQVASRRTARSEVWHTFGELRIQAEAAGGDERYVVQGGHVTEPTPLADILQLDDASHFRLLGRANDLIHVAGKRSSLAHLNYHLNSVPGVVDGAFWLPPDVADGVVRPVAFVVAPALSVADVMSGLRERLEPVFVPRRVVHVESLPREATGKLTASALARLAAAQVSGHRG